MWMQDTGHRSWKGVSPASIRGQTTALAGVRSLRGGSQDVHLTGPGGLGGWGVPGTCPLEVWPPYVPSMDFSGK